MNPHQASPELVLTLLVDILGEGQIGSVITPSALM
jgi:hypothetical protein